MEHRYFSVGAPAMTIGKNTALTWIRDLSAGHPVADRKDIPLLSEDDFESSLDTVCEAAAGSIEGVFGPASLTWRVDREAAVFLGAGRAFFLQLQPPLVAPPLAHHSRTLTHPVRLFHQTFHTVFP